MKTFYRIAVMFVVCFMFANRATSRPDSIVMKSNVLSTGATVGRSDSFFLTNTLGQPAPSDTSKFGFWYTVYRLSQTGSISGQKFIDTNGDGVKNESDSALSGWEIQLLRNGVELVRDTTDSTGNYSFSNLQSGKYLVREIQKQGWIQTTPEADTIMLESGENRTGIDFGNFQLGCIGGIKYNDMYGDSALASDPVVSTGWVIKLYDTLCTLKGRVVTNVNGGYAFTNLIAGTYIVQESLRTEWIQTYPRVSSQGVVLTSCGSYAGTRAYQVTIRSGDCFTNKHFANYQFGKINGRKFHDRNADSSITGDSIIAGWKVKIFKYGSCDSLGVSITDTGGMYQFNNLKAGTYTVEEELQSGWIQNYPRIGSSGVTLPCKSYDGKRAYIVSIVSGSVVTNKDFGNYRFGSISGMAFEDMNANGQKELDEPGLQSWTIFLDMNNNAVLNVGEPAMGTDANGNYAFLNLVPATYYAREVLQSGWKRSTPDSLVVTVSSGQSYTEENFGNYRVGSISGVKFSDRNRNGTFDHNEVTLSGWKIFIERTGEQLPFDSAITATNGSYGFTSLEPDTYKVSEVQQENWSQTTPLYNAVIILSDSNRTDINFGNVYRRLRSPLPATSVAWNIISLPVNTGDNRKEILFPDALSYAFEYLPGIGYVARDSLFPGIGYWLKLQPGDTLEFWGDSRGVDTIDVKSGWNLIGTLSDSILTSTIISLPDSNIISKFYGYDNGYQEADSLQSGYGYWVKVRQNGKLLLSTPAIHRRRK